MRKTAFCFCCLLFFSLQKVYSNPLPSVSIEKKSSSYLEQDYLLLADRDLSSYVGAHDLLSVSSFLRSYKLNKHLDKFLLGRLVLTYLDYFYIGQYVFLVQHEFFGHGYRVRDLPRDSVSVKKYKIEPNWPLFPSIYGGASYTYVERKSTALNSYMDMGIALGGIEANQLYNNVLKMHWLQNKGVINGRVFIDYLNDSFELFYQGIDGNDVFHFNMAFSQTFPGLTVTNKTIRKYGLLNFLDPFVYFAAKAQITYLRYGKPYVMPFIDLTSNLKYMPTTQTGLTPFGLTVSIQNYFLYQGLPIYIYGTYGTQKKLHSYTLGGSIPSIYRWENGMSIGAKADLWLQPIFLFIPGTQQAYGEYFSNTAFIYSYGYPGVNQYKKRPGVSFYLIGDWKNRADNGLHVEVGCKTEGYLPGESLYRKFNLRAGFAYKW